MFYHYFYVKILTNEGKSSRSIKQLVSLHDRFCVLFQREQTYPLVSHTVISGSERNCWFEVRYKAQVVS